MNLKRTTLLLASVVLLSSCTPHGVPEDILTFLNECSTEKAMRSVSSLTMISTTIDKNGNSEDSKVIGKREARTEASHINEKQGFTMTTSELYSGNRVLYDEEAKIYLTEAGSTCVYNQEKDDYTYSVYKRGYSTSELTGELIEQKSQSTYTMYTIYELQNSLFYSNDDNSVSTGGLYYADFFKTRTSYVNYMYVEDNTLVFDIQHHGYKTETEEGYYDSYIKINTLGLLDLSKSFSWNFTKDITSTTEVTASYVISETETEE